MRPHAVPKPRKFPRKSRPGRTRATTLGEVLRSGCPGARGGRRAGRGAINRMSAARAAVRREALLPSAPGRRLEIPAPAAPVTPVAPLRAPRTVPELTAAGRLHFPTVTLTTSVCAGPRGSGAQRPSGSGVRLAIQPAVRGQAWTPRLRRGPERTSRNGRGPAARQQLPATPRLWRPALRDAPAPGPSTAGPAPHGTAPVGYAPRPVRLP